MNEIVVMVKKMLLTSYDILMDPVYVFWETTWLDK